MAARGRRPAGGAAHITAQTVDGEFRLRARRPSGSQEPTPVGHWSNGPIADAWKDGVLWFLSNHHVQ
jgi:hypothetical protein